ncbi:excalibur calcium-binding domain-containing protein [Streptosporangium vulgare]|uniref:Excalibur calcium-binding domain-containing protein n=1 Tax=Streptosporangium vulgare TaxID=46190 RepID=A0ABV5TS87_9ACTN
MRHHQHPGPTPTPAPTSTPDPPSGGNDPRFPTCAAANAAGYGPYRRGTDPEYAWHQDRDGDGVVCER